MSMLTCCQVTFYLIWSCSLLDVWPRLSEGVVNVCETEISWHADANICPDVIHLHSIIDQPPRTRVYSGGCCNWHFVEASELFAWFFSFNWGSTFCLFVLWTLNNIVPLIWMVIVCDSVYSRTEGIKKGYLDSKANVNTCHFLFFFIHSSFHRKFSSDAAVVCTQNTFSQISRHASYSQRSAKWIVYQCTIPPSSGSSGEKTKPTSDNLARLLLQCWDISWQLFFTRWASGCNICATHQICCFSMGDSAVIFLQHRIWRSNSSGLHLLI